MDSKRIKEIQETTGCPQSVSVHKALLQVWNECEQEHQAELKKLRVADVSNRRELLIAFSKYLKKEIDKNFDEEFLVDEFESNL